MAATLSGRQNEFANHSVGAEEVTQARSCPVNEEDPLVITAGARSTANSSKKLSDKTSGDAD